MSSKLLTAPEREGKTFQAAIRLLGLFAVLQMALVAWVLLVRYHGDDPLPSYSASLPTLTDPVEAPSSDSPHADLYREESEESDPSDGGPSTILAQLSLPTSPTFETGARSLRDHPAHRLNQQEARDLLAKALSRREAGDMIGTLEALRDADQITPGHPKIFSELATTLQQMGQTKKASSYWERIHQMGAAGAGAYWDLADMALKGQTLTDSSRIDTYLRITRHSAHLAKDQQGGQRILLRLHVDSTSKEVIQGKEVYLNVLFYDAVNDMTFQPTVADTKPTYLTQPYDWRDANEEIIEVEYFLPKLSDEQEANLGQRKYYGYVVELFYRDLLQDIVAYPRKLARLGSSPSRAARPVIESFPRSSIPSTSVAPPIP